MGGASKFYHRGNPSSLKNGGNLIPKYQNAGNINYLTGKPELQVLTTDYRQPIGTTVGLQTKTVNLPGITVTSSKKQARANRVREASNTSVANLQNALYNIGAFKGIKDRHGNQATFHSAVDGIKGKMTNEAIEKAKSMGYDVDEKTGAVTKKRTVEPVENPRVISKSTQNTPSLFDKIPQTLKGIFQPNDYVPSNAQNMQAVMEHKVKTGVTEPYFYVNPNEGKLYRIQGNNILYSTPVATGVNQSSDGWTTLLKRPDGKPLYDRSTHTSSTGAGVFTLSKKFLNKGTYHNEPYYHLIEAQQGNDNARFTQIAIHAPATEDRAKKLASGQTKLTYGCIQLPNGEMNCLDTNKMIQSGDSVYVEPTVHGNYLYEDKDGKIKTHFEETPQKVSGQVWGKKFDRNDVRYNTGY